MSGLLYQLEEQRDRTMAQYMQDRLQSALDAYRPMCAECDLAMSRHQSCPEVMSDVVEIGKRGRRERRILPGSQTRSIGQDWRDTP